MVMQTNVQDSLYNVPRNIAKGIGFSPRTLSDWLATSPGSQRSAQFGYFGPGQLRKDITAAGDPLQLGDFFTDTYGAKVWDSLNSQTRTFNLIRKVAWGPTTGWRIRSGRNVSTQGVSETGALPTTDSPDLETVHVRPAFIVTSMGVSALAQFVATLEGGIGDALAVEQESAEVDHLKVINRMLMAPGAIRVQADGGTPLTTVAGGGDFVFINDTFHASNDELTSRFITVTAIAGDSITYTEAGAITSPTLDSILYTRTRGGIWSLDDIVNEDARTINGVTLVNGPMYANLTFGARTAGGWNAAGHISGNTGTLRHLATSFIDIVVQNIRQNGFNPDLFITGVEQEVRLGTILQANQHFMGEGKFQVKMGGESTLPGYETGFELATYKKIPIFTDVDTAPVWQLAGNGDALRGTDFFVFDTRFIEMPVLFTTQYLESRDYIHNNLLGIKAIFLTAMNTRCLNFRAQGKITDLTDGVNSN